MANKRLVLGFTLFIVSFLIPFYGYSQSSSKVTAAASQTVVTIQRHPRDNDRKKEMEVYIDGRLYTTTDKKPKAITVENGGMLSIPVFNGVHTIYVKVGKNQSDTINFTANGTVVSFVASVEGGVRGLVQDTVDSNTSEIQSFKTRVVLSRNVVEDDTGSMVNRSVQEAF
jgi:hypothetical protein